jgi:DNA-binding MurR/RpiR family transcriptional regulator
MKESSKKELFEKILRVWPDLSQKKKRVADFILEDYKRIFLLTAKEFAQQCDVSEPTIVRFVMDLGFSGYSDFMRYIKGLLHIELTSVDRMAKASKKFNGGTTLETYYQNTAINLGNMMNSISEGDVKSIAQMVYSASSVIVAGYRASASLATYFGYLLRKIRDEVLIDTVFKGETLDHIALHGPSILLIVIAFPRYPNTAIEIIKYAKKYNVLVFGLSDTHKSPIISLSDRYCIIDVEGVSFVDPFAHIITFLGVLIHEIAFLDRENTIKRLAKIEDGIRNRKDFYTFDESEQTKQKNDDQLGPYYYEALVRED